MQRGFWIAFLLALTLPGLAAAQRMEPSKDWEVGDKAIFAWTLNNKTQQVEEECTGVTDQEVRIRQKLAARTLEAALAKGSYQTLRAMCISNGQQCGFSPALEFASLPLERGKQWSQTFTVNGETFTAEVTQERKAEKIEKVKVPAGEFDAFKIAYTGRIRGTDAKGSPFSGKEEGSNWVALVNGKITVVKMVYRNSFGEKASRELTSISFK
jgi:hypothetical protein